MCNGSLLDYSHIVCFLVFSFHVFAYKKNIYNFFFYHIGLSTFLTPCFFFTEVAVLA